MISILIVNYNTGKILEKCIESLFRFENEKNFEVIIADNSSSDNSKEIIKKLCADHQNIQPLFVNAKVSFSEANNKAFEISKGKYILIMNPDIIFTMPVFDKLISDLKENESLGVVCPLLLGTDRKFQSGYFQKFPTLRQYIYFYSLFAKSFLKNEAKVSRYLENRNIVHGDKLVNVEQIPCAFFFTTRSLFESVGGMDNDYELFFEDVDLSYRINKIKKLAVDTSLSVTHLGGESFKTSDDYWLYGRFILSMITFFKKHYGESLASKLKFISKINSRMVLGMESILKIFGKNDDYRKRKHEHFLKEYKKTFS